ncbi:MAG: hypothetical protein NVSMB10_15400 [Steroidobacteraceae bacterium]
MGVPSRWPRLLASSVIRGAHLGESHGGIYLLNLETGAAELKIDWNRTDIDFSGRGGDRGLRGIAFARDLILIAANAQLLVFDTEFRLLETHANRFLKHCHEICVDGRNVYLTSTGFDSVLVFDLDTKRFSEGWHLAAAAQGPVLRYYDPSSTTGPAESHRFHINSVSAASSRIWLSGLYTPGLLLTDRRTLQIAAPLPWGTHNAQPHADGILYNDTEAQRICHRVGTTTKSCAVPAFAPGSVVNEQRYGTEVARARFARGLCILPDGFIAAGSSPSTVSVYDMRRGEQLLQMNLSMDVRNAIHGLAVWPYG